MRTQYTPPCQSVSTNLLFSSAACIIKLETRERVDPEKTIVASRVLCRPPYGKISLHNFEFPNQGFRVRGYEFSFLSPFLSLSSLSPLCVSVTVSHLLYLKALLPHRRTVRSWFLLSYLIIKSTFLYFAAVRIHFLAAPWSPNTVAPSLWLFLSALLSVLLSCLSPFMSRLVEL